MQMPILISLIALLTLATAGRTAELVMLEQAGCVYCQKWEAEIGIAYPRTREGKLAPLRKVDINAPIPEDLKEMRLERFTPTFILMQDGIEIGRIRGYVGDEFFWFLLSEQLEKLNRPEE